MDVFKGFRRKLDLFFGFFFFIQNRFRKLYRLEFGFGADFKFVLNSVRF